MTKPATVLLACEYADNYLRIGTRTFHVTPEDIAKAVAAAQAHLAAIQPTEPPDTAPESAAESTPEASIKKRRGRSA